MKKDASAFAMTLVRIFVQRPFFFCKLIGFGIMGAVFLAFLLITLVHIHSWLFTAQAEATVASISLKSGGETSSFHASYNDGEWKTKNKTTAPSEETYHYTLHFIDKDGKKRSEEMDSLSKEPLSLNVGDALSINYSTLIPEIIWSQENAFATKGDGTIKSLEEDLVETRKILFIGIAIGIFLYLVGRGGIFITDRILLSVQNAAVQALREQRDKETSNNKNPDA